MLTIYSTSTCAACHMVERLLTNKGIKYEVVNLDNDQAKRQELYDITGMLMVPVTTDGKTYVVGWNVAKLMNLIKEVQTL